MTTPDPIDALLDKLTIESAKELGNGYVVYARGMAYVIDAVRAALSSLPAQAVGDNAILPNKVLEDNYARALAADGASGNVSVDTTVMIELINEVKRSRSAPSQPAAVGEALTIVIDVASTTAARHREEGRKVLADQIDAAIALVHRDQVKL